MINSKSLKNWRKNPHIYPLLFIWLTSAIGMSVQNDLLSYALPGRMILLLACFAAAVYLGFAAWKLRFAAGLLAGFFLAVGVLILAGQAQTAQGVLRAFAGWYLLGRENALTVYYPFSLGITGLLLTALAVPAMRYSQLWRGLAGVVLLLFVGSVILNRPFSELTVVLGFLYLFLSAVDLCQKHAERQEETKRRQILLTLLPVIFLLGLLLKAAPSSEQPYDWKFLRDLGHMVSEGIEEATDLFRFYAGGGSDVFSLNFTGYSEEANLGDGLEKKDETDLLVSFQASPRVNLYLVGSVWDMFADGVWSAAAGEAPKEPDYFMESTSLYLEDKEKNTLYTPVRMTVTYEDIFTQTLFLPERTTFLSIPSKSRTQEANRVRLSKPMGNGNSYELVWQQLNLGSEEWDAFVRWQMEQPAVKDEYTEYIYETYMQVPEISEKAQAYIREVAAGCDNGYEQLLAVEALLQQYTYTRHPQPLAEGADFLEQFLLENQEGYCTYFATAFVLISRYLGFPARYVQGYCVPVQGVHSGMSVKVSSEYAHAWPEVWLDGVGWIPFEPTPSYGELRYVPWTTQKQTEQPMLPELSGVKPAQPDISEEEEVVEQPEPRGLPVIWKGIGLAMFVLLALAAGVLLILEQQRRRRRRRMSAEEAFARNILFCEYILTAAGMPRAEWETFGTYQERLLRNPELAELVSGIPFREYEALCYGGIVPEREVLAAAEAAGRALYDSYKGHHGRLQNWLLFWKLRYGSL